MNDKEILSELSKVYTRIGSHIALATTFLFTGIWVSVKADILEQYGVLVPALLFGMMTGCVLRSGWLIFCACMDMLVLFTKLGYEGLPLQRQPKNVVGRMVQQDNGDWVDRDQRPAIFRQEK